MKSKIEELQKSHETNNQGRRLEKSYLENIEDIKAENNQQFTYELVNDVVFDEANSAMNHKSELKCAIALTMVMESFGKIDNLLSEQVRRRNDAMHELELYRITLADRLRKKSETYLGNKNTKSPNLALAPKLKEIGIDKENNMSGVDHERA